jgi:uncharacterized protein (TIGR03083 family)
MHKDEGVTAPSASPVEAVAALFEIERARLLDLLKDLEEQDWQRPSPCPGWTVLGLASHLLGDDFGILARLRDNYMGTASPEGLSEGEFIDWLDELQMEWVRAARRVSPRLVVELLEWTGPRLVAFLGDEDLTERSACVSWAGPAPVPRWLDQLRELSEYWIHRQQLLEAVGRPVDLDPTLLRPVLLGLRWAFPYRLSQADLASDGAVQITVGEPVNERWTLVASNGAWNFSEASPEHFIARASLTADEAWRLLTNNLRHASSRLEISGEERAAAVLLSTRAIIGHPK